MRRVAPHRGYAIAGAIAGEAGLLGRGEAGDIAGQGTVGFGKEQVYLGVGRGGEAEVSGDQGFRLPNPVAGQAVDDRLVHGS